VRIGSLCSGYGGLDMGVSAVLGGEPVWFVEYDAAPSKILAHHWPDVPNYGDATTVEWASLPAVDIITAGYPCQPFSVGGKRKGSNDERHLWPHVLDAVRQLRPRYVVLENVRGHLTLGFDAVLGDLAEAGYDTDWICIPASDAGAPHERQRVFILATSAPSDTEDERHERPGDARHGRAGSPDCGGVAADAERDGRERRGAAGDVVGPPREGEGDGDQRERDGDAPDDRWRTASAWGPFAVAIERWSGVLGRFAPAPTRPDGTLGRDRLSPEFVEWMMGLPAGHVTGVDIDRSAQLKALGNGVVPQHAALALSLLIDASLNAIPTEETR
jgi:DNA (cytosine-5)-methyltransferase 1